MYCVCRDEEIGCAGLLEEDGVGSRIGNVGSRYSNGEVGAPPLESMRGRVEPVPENDVDVCCFGDVMD